MNLLLVTGRIGSSSDQRLRGEAETIARSLSTSGARVRWLRPRAPGEAETEIAGVEMIGAESAVPPFGAITGRLYDVPNETLLVGQLREDPPALMHVHGFGGASTYLSGWLGERLGVPSLVVADPIEAVLCARGTLVDEVGRSCERWSEAARCLECCRTPFEGGLSPGQAWRARHLGFLGPLSPGPVVEQFKNRLDMIVHGLDSADRVLCRDARSSELLEAAGLPRGALVGIPAPEDLLGWRAHYGAVLAQA